MALDIMSFGSMPISIVNAVCAKQSDPFLLTRPNPVMHSSSQTPPLLSPSGICKEMGVNCVVVADGGFELPVADKAGKVLLYS